MMMNQTDSDDLTYRIESVTTPATTTTTTAAGGYCCSSNATVSSSTTLIVNRDSRETAEILYYTLLVLFGGPLNLLAFYKSLKKTFLTNTTNNNNKKHRKGKIIQKQGGGARTLNLLILNLNLTDFIIIFIYLPTQIFWRITVQWYGGDLMCRFLRFLHQLSFHLSSYTVAGIATERFNAVSRKTFNVTNKLHARFLLGTIWLISLLCSSPNLIIWQVYEPWPGYFQCTTQFIASFHANRTTGWQSNQSLNASFQIGGILTVFWLPAFYISLLYLYIFIKLRRLAQTDITTAAVVGTTTGTRIRASSETTVVISAYTKAAGSTTRYHRLKTGDSKPQPKNNDEPPPAMTPHTDQKRSECGAAARMSSIGCNHSQRSAAMYRKQRSLESPLAVSSKSLAGVTYVKVKSSGRYISKKPPPPRQSSLPSQILPFESAEGPIEGHNQTQQLDQQQQPRRSSVPQWRLQLQSKQVLFSKTGLLVLVYFACWLPYFASSLMPAQLKILAVLIAMNAAVNPIIYHFN